MEVERDGTVFFVSHKVTEWKEKEKKAQVMSRLSCSHLGTWTKQSSVAAASLPPSSFPPPKAAFFEGRRRCPFRSSPFPPSSFSSAIVPKTLQRSVKRRRRRRRRTVGGRRTSECCFRGRKEWMTHFLGCVSRRRRREEEEKGGQLHFLSLLPSRRLQCTPELNRSRLVSLQRRKA